GAAAQPTGSSPSPARGAADVRAPAPAAAAALAAGEIRVRLLGPRRLRPGDDFERTLRAGEHHLYRLEVPAGRLAVVGFEQLGSDVLVQPRDPAGAALVPFDSPTGGQGTEWVYLLGEPGGTYELLVRGWDAGEAGTYRVSVEPPIAGGPEQRRLTRAEQLLAEAYDTDDPAIAIAAAEAFVALGRPEREAMARFEAGKNLLERGANAEAEPHLRRAVELFLRQGKDYWSANAMNDLSLSLMRTGKLAEAEPFLLQSLPYHQAVEGWEDHANALDHLGRLAATYGDSDQAFRYFEQGLELLDNLDEPLRATNKARLERRMADEYLALGHVAQARHHGERALRLLEDAGPGNQDDKLMTRYNLCRVLQRERDLPRAARCFAAVAQDNRELGIEREEAVSLISLGQVLRDLGRLPEAREALERARATFEQREETRPLGNALNSLGELELEAGRPRRALEHFQRAVERGDDRRGRARSWLGVARCWRTLEEPSQALAALERFIALTEEHRSESVGASLQASFFARRQDGYGMAVDLLMEFHAEQPEAGWAERAFEISERARARALLDLLEVVIVQTGGVTGAERELARELEAVEAWRADAAQLGRPAEELASVDRRIENLQLRLQRLRAGRRTGRELGRESAGQPLELEVIQRRVLADDLLLLAYDLGPQRSYLWIVSPDRLETVILPPQAEIEALATRAYDLARESYRRTARIAAEAALQRLADVLVAPVAERLDGKRLLVRSDGSLQYVPWAALPLPGGRRLVEEHEVVVLPSSSVVAALRERAARRAPAAGTLAVVADPVFDERDPRLTGVAGGPAATRRSAAERFDRLPHSSGEARALLDLAGGGTLLEGFEATRRAVLEGALSGHRYVHFATHAQIHPRQPGLSSLVLSGVDRAGRARPGLLRARAVYDLELPAELVVLSACRTALGEELAGEGLMGLTQGFFAAGAQRVVSSLWDVDDLATALLMEHLYRGILEEGLAPAAALRQAQLTLAREPRWRAPYFWAGFVLQGEPN
ncbi:MAG TPA: CHAT domain-containing protein, partial [Thermoanaerobaculia bacterium]|nr:CHAT domain-containing protein [Thermoanaerobaculia bacterium]